MKNYFFAFTILFSVFPTMADDNPLSREVQIGISGVFVPGPFDANTDAYVIVNGIFQNGCYKWSRADIISVQEFIHEIRTYANVLQSSCMMVLIPFQNEVRFGQLKSGEHKLKFINGDGTFLENTLTVK